MQPVPAPSTGRAYSSLVNIYIEIGFKVNSSICFLLFLLLRGYNSFQDLICPQDSLSLRSHRSDGLCQKRVEKKGRYQGENKGVLCESMEERERGSASLNFSPSLVSSLPAASEGPGLHAGQDGNRVPAKCRRFAAVTLLFHAASFSLPQFHTL